MNIDPNHTHKLFLSPEEQKVPEATRAKIGSDNIVENKSKDAMFDAITDLNQNWKKVDEGFRKKIDTMSESKMIGIISPYADELKKEKLEPYVQEYFINIVHGKLRETVFNMGDLANLIFKDLEPEDLCRLSAVSKFFYNCSRKHAAEHYGLVAHRKIFRIISGLCPRIDATSDKKNEERLMSVQKYLFSMCPFRRSVLIADDVDKATGEKLSTQIQYPQDLKEIFLDGENPVGSDPLDALAPLIAKCSSLQSIELRRITNVDIKSFEKLAASCPNLKSITLYRSTIKAEGCAVFNKQFKEVVEFTYNRNGLEVPRSQIGLLSIILNCPQLKILTLEYCKECPILVVKKLPSLTHLTLTHLYKDHYKNKELVNHNEKLLLSGQYCSTKLESLDLSNNELVTDAVISNFAERCKNLKIVDVNHCEKLTSAAVNSLVTFCPGLTSVSFKGVRGVKNNDVNSLLTLKNLKKLDLTSTSITLDDLKNFVKPLMKSTVDEFKINEISKLEGANTSNANEFKTSNIDFIKRFNLE